MHSLLEGYQGQFRAPFVSSVDIMINSHHESAQCDRKENPSRFTFGDPLEHYKLPGQKRLGVPFILNGRVSIAR